MANTYPNNAFFNEVLQRDWSKSSDLLDQDDDLSDSEGRLLNRTILLGIQSEKDEKFKNMETVFMIVFDHGNITFTYLFIF